ncbi:MAG: ParB family transcriptional regulator [Treponematales bacterium]
MKLQANTAGWNAGKTYLAKSVRIADIVIDPEISKVFSIDEKTLAGVTQKMKTAGYDKSEPVVIWKDQNILVDGHTRLAAAKELGLEEIPAVEMEFADREDALLYCFERQKLRRNLTSREILVAAELIHNKTAGRKAKGQTEEDSGHSAEQMAEKLGVSRSTLYQARKVLREASEEDLEAVKAGKKSIKAAYTAVKKTKTPAPVPAAKTVPPFAPKNEPEEGPETDSWGNEDSPEAVRFLKSAVTLLARAKEVSAALMLIDHFLKKKERNGFIQRLPQEVQRLFFLHLAEGDTGVAG